MALVQVMMCAKAIATISSRPPTGTYNIPETGSYNRPLAHNPRRMRVNGHVMSDEYSACAVFFTSPLVVI